MGTVITIVVVVLVVVAAIVALLVKRRASASSAAAAADIPPVAKVRPPEKPMDGLESALAAATGRDGRPMSEKIEAEAGHVDELRDPDDTGPLLRRALDHVNPGHADGTSGLPDDDAVDGSGG